MTAGQARGDGKRQRAGYGYWGATRNRVPAAAVGALSRCPQPCRARAFGPSTSCNFWTRSGIPTLKSNGTTGPGLARYGRNRPPASRSLVRLSVACRLPAATAYLDVAGGSADCSGAVSGSRWGCRTVAARALYISGTTSTGFTSTVRHRRAGCMHATDTKARHGITVGITVK